MAKQLKTAPQTIHSSLEDCRRDDETPQRLGFRPRERDHAVEEAFRRRIEENGVYSFYFSDVTCKCSAGIVKVCGRVPTDRLKQALCSLILGLDGVTEIDDQLDVVSSTVLSSVHPR